VSPQRLVAALGRAVRPVAGRARLGLPLIGMLVADLADREAGVRLVSPRHSAGFHQPHQAFGWFHIPGLESWWTTNTREFKVRVKIDTKGLGLERDVVVVDNASGDGTVDAVQTRFPSARLVANDRNVGFSAAVNQGIRATSGTYVLLLNPDTVPGETALRVMCDFLDAHPEAGAVDHLLGACLLARRVALGQVGGMDEGYFLFIEDTDLCYRLKQAGWKIFLVPDSEVVHAGGQSTRHRYVESNRRPPNHDRAEAASRDRRRAGPPLITPSASHGRRPIGEHRASKHVRHVEE